VGTLLDQLQQIRWRTEQLVDGLSPEQLTRRPDPARWSIADCLAHLNTIAAIYQPCVDAAIRQGREGKVFGRGPFNPGWLGGLLKWLAEPPPKIRFRAPRNILPPSTIADPGQVIAEFTRAQDEWERQIRECDGLDLEKVKCETPFPPMPCLRLAAPIPWMLAHERRHLMQAEKVKAEIQAKAAPATGNLS
jgi:hypothetical protein